MSLQPKYPISHPNINSTRHEQIPTIPSNKRPQIIPFRTHSPRHIPTPTSLIPSNPRTQRGNDSGSIFARYTDPDGFLVPILALYLYLRR